MRTRVSLALNGRIRELIAQLQTERDQDRFTMLVEELNRLLDETLPSEPSEF
jgi:hypothetical protein